MEKQQVQDDVKTQVERSAKALGKGKGRMMETASTNFETQNKLNLKLNKVRLKSPDQQSEVATDAEEGDGIQRKSKPSLNKNKFLTGGQT